MADLRRKDLFNQKRNDSWAVFKLTEAEILDGALVATLPARTVVSYAYAVVTTASGTTGATIDVKVGNTVVTNELAVDALGVAKGTPTTTFFPTGGNVTVVAGSTAPATGSLVVEVMLHYMELDMTDGTYIS